VTHLRKMMLEELQLRNYAQDTIRHYLRAVEDFARRFRCSPDRLAPRHIREYQAELFQKRKLSANSVGQHLAALRFFYIKTLRRAWSLADTPYPKKTRQLPTILSREEVTQLIDAARTPGERILLMTLYATGVRCSELTHLKIGDIDSQRMVVHIHGGKGRKDRHVMLSPRLLTALRTHWCYYHRKSSTWLFPSNFRKDRPIDTKTVWYAFSTTDQLCGMRLLSPTRKLCVLPGAPYLCCSPSNRSLFPPSSTTVFAIFFRRSQFPRARCHVSCPAAPSRHGLTPLLPTIEFA
jgi:integrase/recombinase XerD